LAKKNVLHLNFSILKFKFNKNMFFFFFKSVNFQYFYILKFGLNKGKQLSLKNTHVLNICLTFSFSFVLVHFREPLMIFVKITFLKHANSPCTLQLISCTDRAKSKLALKQAVLQYRYRLYNKYYIRQNRIVRQMDNPLFVKCLWIRIPSRIIFSSKKLFL